MMDIPNPTDKVLLRGKTRHGKNRINQHGNIWLVENIDKFGGEPAMFLRSLNKTEGRWVLLKNDPNFLYFY
jgi:hypothetical protein